ncbi:hypothetical protein [Marinoscillum furvescens]|uniref:Uncharacterized protein n=1 Tax=Marinoscillum furvescens DSM 4134 TaxID=1122208 RepID=A0A3D9L6N6_MARFU|nr:hypothetical protein [Marinoscillum furvescens]REE01134.1 hypothetical protein C7460_104154 [Marinoscillum furvescens DSM 4134]
MKAILNALFLSLIMLISFAELTAQPQKIGNADSYTSIAADTSLQDLNFQYFGNATTFTVGVLYSKGASEDSLSVLQVYHALIPDAATADLGRKISNDTLLQFDHPGPLEYKEQTITVPGGVGYLNFWYNKAATATDTFTLAPRIFIKPKL